LKRYVCIFYHASYNKTYSIRNTIYFSISTWIVAFIINAPNFSSKFLLIDFSQKVSKIFNKSQQIKDDIAGFFFDRKTLQCVFNRLKIGYTWAFSISCIFIPCTGIAFCYLRIFLYSWSIKNKVLNNEVKNRSRLRKNLEAIKITKSLFASFFLFALCWFVSKQI
jgi:hypothetical protein